MLILTYPEVYLDHPTGRHPPKLVSFSGFLGCEEHPSSFDIENQLLLIQTLAGTLVQRLEEMNSFQQGILKGESAV